MQQTMRTLAFICESCVFAYLGLAIFSFPHRLETALIIWSIIFILIGRALNIFPLAAVCNKFRQHQITKVWESKRFPKKMHSMSFFSFRK